MTASLDKQVVNSAARPRARPMFYLLLSSGAYLALILLAYHASEGRSPKVYYALFAVHCAASVTAILVLSRSRASIALRPAPFQGFSVAILFTLFLALIVPLAWWSADGYLVSDENAYRFLARIFAAGKLYTDAPLEAINHLHNHISFQGRWFVKYPPGWPMLLALAELLHFAWIFNPLLSLGYLWLTYRISVLLFDRATGRIAILFAVLSPYYLISSITYLSHPACAVCTAGATLLFMMGIRSGQRRYFAAMCVTLAFAILIRPYTAFCIGSVLCVATICGLWQNKKHLFFILAVGTVAGLVSVALWGKYNHVLTGSYMTNLYSLERGRASMEEISLNPAVIASVSTAKLTAWRVARTVLFTVPLLFVLAIYGLALEGKRQRQVLLLATIYMTLAAGHVIETDNSGATWGERYYFEAFFCAAILAARGWIAIRDRYAISAPMAAILLLFGMVIISAQSAMLLPQAISRLSYSAAVGRALRKLPYRNAVIYLRDVDEFNFNPNAADWRSAKHVYFPDPKSVRTRVAVACELDRTQFAVVTYDNAGLRVLDEHTLERADCTSPRAQVLPQLQPHPLGD